MDKSYNARKLRDFMRSRRITFETATRAFDLSAARGWSLDLALGVAVKEERDRGGPVRTAPYLPGPGDFRARQRISDAQEREREQIEREAEKTAGQTGKQTGKGKARNPFSFLASQAHKQNRALLNLTTRKPSRLTAAKTPTEPKSKSIQAGKYVIAGSIVEHLEGRCGR